MARNQGRQATVSVVAHRFVAIRESIRGAALSVAICFLQIVVCFASQAAGQDSAVLQSLESRFSQSDWSGAETPDFQRHIAPLLGRLGCNGRACHGSFQGQGGLQLSLFGYDFRKDFEALRDSEAGRIDASEPSQSLVLQKPLSEDEHGGGQRFTKDDWSYRAMRSWLEADAPFNSNDKTTDEYQRLESLVVSPAELQFGENALDQPLRVTAHWENGVVEDVTCLCRFQTNDSSICLVDENGVVRKSGQGDTHLVVTYDSAVVPVPVLSPVSDLAGSNYPQLKASTRIDELVQEKLKKLGVLPSAICSDAEFLRRVSLDMTGTLPGAAEVEAFLADSSGDKRNRKIEELLSRPSFAARWTTFLCDITGNNASVQRNFFPIQAQPDRQWYEWIYKRIADNVPYDELVESIVVAESRVQGESYREYCQELSEICRDTTGKSFAERPGLVQYWSRTNFRTPEERAVGFAYSFLGVRIQCAQCHKHPFDRWTQDDFESFQKLFEPIQVSQFSIASDARSDYAQMLRELDIDTSLRGNQLRRELGVELRRGETIPIAELVVGATGQRRFFRRRQTNVSGAGKLLGGEWIEFAQSDPREHLMEWLRDPENPYFATAIVNRVWAQYFGVGIVEEPDDLNLGNPPSNAPLLDYLVQGLVQSGYDLHWLHRTIVTSDAYQRSWETNETNALDTRNFARAQLRRLPAEVAYDALVAALGNDSKIERMIQADRSRALTKTPPGDEQMRRRRREDDGMLYALDVFGASLRESNCDCDRSSDPNLLQTVFVLNDPAVQNLLVATDGWVSQVADEYGWQPVGAQSTYRGNNDGRTAQVVEAVRRRVEDLDQRIQLARRQQRTGLEYQLKRRRSQLVSRASDAARARGIEFSLKREETGAAATRNKPLAWDEIITAAYLRTLSRYPTPSELSVSRKYVAAADRPVEGLTDLAWSLVNTQEFILNH